MKLIIFDCDGTIVDSQHAIAAAMSAAFDDHGLVQPERSDVIGVVGLSLVEAVSRLLPDGADAGLADPVAQTYKRAFADLRQRSHHHEPLFPGAAETIAALAAREDYLLGVATGKSRRGVDALFEREGLAKYFVTIQTADDHPSKPHPSMIERAMSECGTERPQTIMIGDTSYDIEMACAADVAGIGVGWGYHPRDVLQRAGARAIVSDYSGLPATIARLFETSGGVAA
ncbi:MAG: HAD-IA family hydrolase [Alphaproteobacteria bacterium]|nr:HAD-IA family hydrolase [Alphaproteobacteria bacterium]